MDTASIKVFENIKKICDTAIKELEKEEAKEFKMKGEFEKRVAGLKSVDKETKDAMLQSMVKHANKSPAAKKYATQIANACSTLV
jgi:hypothetical protein